MVVPALESTFHVSRFFYKRQHESERKHKKEYEEDEEEETRGIRVYSCWLINLRTHILEDLGKHMEICYSPDSHIWPNTWTGRGNGGNYLVEFYIMDL